jgi:hypothetical protein
MIEAPSASDGALCRGQRAAAADASDSPHYQQFIENLR